jgi:hypothetical protein
LRLGRAGHEQLHQSRTEDVLMMICYRRSLSTHNSRQDDEGEHPQKLCFHSDADYTPPKSKKPWGQAFDSAILVSGSRFAILKRIRPRSRLKAQG